jgi:hypothetical protein
VLVKIISADAPKSSKVPPLFAPAPDERLVLLKGDRTRNCIRSGVYCNSLVRMSGEDCCKTGCYIVAGSAS